ncbi:MAG: hypothetical protein R3B48_22965 [Kofleriaceae bacterium]
MRTLTLASLFFATGVVAVSPTPAAAQSGPPGQCECAPEPAPTPRPPRWARYQIGVDLRVGSLGLGDPEAPDHQQFATGGIAVRWRMSQRLELHGSLDHGSLAEQGDEPGNEPGTEGPQVTAVTASLRYHFRTDAPLGWYLHGGLGASSIESADRTVLESRPHLAFGAGLQYRFDHVVLGAELSLLALGQREREASGAGVGASAVAAPAPGADPEDEGGGQFTLVAGWDF